jgi:hypothetical protein
MWVIDAADGAEWRTVDAYPDKPDHLSVRMRFAPTGDGVAVAGIQVERTDGRALTARDLRLVRLPPNWVLFGETAVRWYQPSGDDAVRSRKGPKGDDEARDRRVWDLYQAAMEVAPRAPVRWMLPQLGVSDATARRWIGRARQRAKELGWPDGAQETAGNR